MFGEVGVALLAGQRQFAIELQIVGHHSGVSDLVVRVQLTFVPNPLAALAAELVEVHGVLAQLERQETIAAPAEALAQGLMPSALVAVLVPRVPRYLLAGQCFDHFC